jgi:DNA-binding CsgD family transcriptional regulator
MDELAQQLEELGGADITAALEEVPVRSFVVDRDGIVRWQNAASRAAIGDYRGRRWTDVSMAPWSAQVGDFLIRVVSSGEPAEFSFEVTGVDGEPERREISAAPLRDGDAVVGIFGVSTPERCSAGSTPPAEHNLTPRQLEILQLLADGKSTSQIAEELYLSKTTVRNHIAHVLANLGVHTRVQAVVAASRLGLIRMPRAEPPAEG